MRLTALLLAVFLLAGCARVAPTAQPAGGASAIPASGGEAAPAVGDAGMDDGGAEPAEQAEPLKLGERWYAFRAQVGDAVVALPLAPQQWAALGWTVAAEATLEPNQTADTLCETPNGAVMVRFANQSDRLLTLAECPVVGLAAGTPEAEAAASVDVTTAGVTGLDDATANVEPAAFALPGGVALGTARDAVLALYGAPDGRADDDVLTYSAGRKAAVTLRLENGKVAGLAMLCLEPMPAPPAAEDLPPQAQAYTPPAELGNEVWRYNILYGGELYTLPAPAAAFMQNGWTLCDEGTVAPGGFCMGVGLRRGNQVLHTTLYNLSESDQPLTGCFVVMAESSNSTRIPLALPNGLEAGCTYAEALALMGAPDETERDMNSHTLIYNGPDGKVVLRFAPGDDLDAMPMFDLEVWHMVASK